ncbi:MAG TPA: hypothetical protein VKB78_15390, partial [Pirellulales bacterium]|nr:hypothetical protein [Pirellulales bacterium]
MNTLRSMLACFALLICLVSTVRAAPEWNLATGGKWNVAGNWSTDLVPDGPTVTADMHDRLTTVTSAGNIIDLEGMNRTVKQLDFQTTNLSVFYNIANGTLTLGDASNAGAISVGAANSNDQTISAGLNYANAATT